MGCAGASGLSVCARPCVALAAVHGPQALLTLAAERLQDPQVLELARRVCLSVDPELDSLFPRRTPAPVTLCLRGDELGRRVDSPKGDSDNPLSRAALEAKFRSLASRGGLPPERIEGILSATRDLVPRGLASFLETLRPESGRMSP